MGICGRSLCLGARALSLVLLLVLSACGGGGGGGSPAPGAPLAPPPVVKQEAVPSGARVDLRASNFFPYAAGDTWDYITYNNFETGNVKNFERVGFEPTADLSAFPAKARSIIFPIEEYPEPFFGVGKLRTVYRSGGWGEDLDGDGFEEGFKFTYAQIYRGTESFAVSGGTVTTARFSNTITFELIPSDARVPAAKVISTEEVQFAANFGMVKRVDKTVDDANRVLEPEVTWIISDATVSGRNLAESVLDGTSTIVLLEHTTLVADPLHRRYIAVRPAAGTFPGGLATVDATTGAILQTLTIPEQPDALTVSPDGRSLYVGFNGTGELAKYDLATMTLVARTSLSGIAVSIAVSPVDPESVAVARTDLCPNCSGATTGVLMLKSMVVQPKLSYESFYSTRLLAFDPTGSQLFSFDSGTTAWTFARHLVLTDGLQPDVVLPGTDFIWPRTMWVDGSKLVIGKHVFGFPGPGYESELRPGLDYRCWPFRSGASTGRAVCMETATEYPRVGVTPRRVALIDVANGVRVGNPSYARIVDDEPAVLVTGIVGQIAMSEREYGFETAFRRIRIYSSPLLR